jgi:amidase
VSGGLAATPGELAFAGLAGQAALLARGEVSSTELVQRSLDAIAATQGTLNAFRCVREPAARAEAEQADRRLAAGELAPLLGVPVAIKDDVDIAGETTEFGCRGTFAPKRTDAEAVRRLKAAGAVIVGKTTSPELGQWPITEGAAFGVTRNPWHLGHTPGGSSGGSAAAVAAGLVAGALGSDGLGSIRIPAAWTHLVGIKPQRGRISTWPDREAFKASPASAHWPGPSPTRRCCSTRRPATTPATPTARRRPERRSPTPPDASRAGSASPSRSSRPTRHSPQRR